MGIDFADQRVVILSTDPGGGTGAYTMLGYFLEAAAGQDDLPCVVLPTTSPLYRSAIERGFPTLPLPVQNDRLREHLGAGNELAEQLRGARALCAWHTRGFELALLLRRKLGIPAMAIYHDPPDAPAHSSLRRALMRFCTRRFDARIFVSHATEALWTELTQKRGINAVIHNGLPDHDLPVRAPSLRVRIGFLGMYAPHKGFDVLRGWMDTPFQTPVQWRLYGKPAPELKAEAQSLAAQRPEEVVLCGHRQPDEIFGEIDILVHLSTQFDPYPTVLLEAARAGVPAIASRLGGSPEIIRPEETGFLMDPRTPETGVTALQSLIEDRARREQMGRNARLHFEQHLEIGPMVDAYRQLWNQLAPRNASHE